MKDPEVHVHRRSPVSFRQKQDPMVMSNLGLLIAVEDGVAILQEEGEEEGATGDWGIDEGLGICTFVIVSVRESLELLVNHPIFWELEVLSQSSPSTTSQGSG